MASTRKAMDSSELLKRLRAAIRKDSDFIPDGWKTSFELSNEWKMSRSHALRLIKKAIDLGMMEQKQFRIGCKTRGNYPIWHYRSKKA